MLTATLLSRVQTLLDDASDSIFSNTEIYAALTEGQNSIIGLHLAVWKAKLKVNPKEELPESLRVLHTTTTGTGTASLPSDFYEHIDVYTSTSPVRVRELSRSKSGMVNNTYLASSSTSPYCSFTSTQIVFETSVEWTMDYLKKPDAIASGTNPVLPDTFQDALVNYAFSEMMRKDKQTGRANEAYGRFMNSIQQIY